MRKSKTIRITAILVEDGFEVKYETKKDRRAHKTEKGVRKYVYAPTMFPKENYRLTVKSRYESAEIIIEGTKEFADLLENYSKEARETVIDSEE